MSVIDPSRTVAFTALSGNGAVLFEGVRGGSRDCGIAARGRRSDGQVVCDGAHTEDAAGGALGAELYLESPPAYGVYAAGVTGVTWHPSSASRRKW